MGLTSMNFYCCCANHAARESCLHLALILVGMSCVHITHCVHVCIKTSHQSVLLAAFFQQHIARDNYVYMVVANRDELDMEVFRPYGEIKEYSLEELFGYWKN